MTTSPPVQRSGTPDAPGTDRGPAPSRPGRRRVALTGIVAGLVAVLGALALPFAPVLVEQPVVSWPQRAGAPESTSLPLTAGRPLAFDASWDCATVTRAAAGSPGWCSRPRSRNARARSRRWS